MMSEQITATSRSAAEPHPESNLLTAALKRQWQVIEQQLEAKKLTCNQLSYQDSTPSSIYFGINIPLQLAIEEQFTLLTKLIEAKYVQSQHANAWVKNPANALYGTNLAWHLAYRQQW